MLISKENYKWKKLKCLYYQEVPKYSWKQQVCLCIDKASWDVWKVCCGVCSAVFSSQQCTGDSQFFHVVGFANAAAHNCLAFKSAPAQTQV
jgi:hypothetical protein